MSNRDRLDSYLKQLEKRLRLNALLRGAALLTSIALGVTLALVLVTNAFAFSAGSLTAGRIILFAVLAVVVCFGAVLPVRAINRRRTANKAEAVFPQFQQRLVTLADRDAQRSEAFTELLAADTLDLAGSASPQRLASDRKLMFCLGGSLACLGVLIWMIAAGPGYLGYGAARLWTGASRNRAAFYDIRVSPGDAAVRRNASQAVTAQLAGFASPQVRLYARYASASKWTMAEMQPQQDGPGFQFVFAGVPESVEYYVEAGRVRSRHFNLRVIDLPYVKRIRATYHYPAWTGLKDSVDTGGDLHAVEGTRAELEVFTDRPLDRGMLALKSGQQITLTGGQGNLYKGTVQIVKDGAYHVAALDHGQLVRLSDDFLIEAHKAQPPEVSVIRPRGDYKASPIEEVTVSATASDEFGLRGVTLHYSVNGGPERSVNLLSKNNAKQATGSAILYLEKFKVVPGDIVSFYAQARDGRTQSHTPMSFVEVQPFEREYSQSQVAGGGGMGGQQQSQISEREKEIIAATWSQEGGAPSSQKSEAAEMGAFLSSAQSKLRKQALSLSGRLDARGLSEANDDFSEFQKDMSAAAAAMKPASEKLLQKKWTAAMPDEERSLQQLLRAEATFRRIQVAFGSQGGGGGAGAGRDLADLFNLELDTAKNQYETGQTAQSASQRAQQLDKTLEKLDEIAHRQQQLAEQRSNSSAQNFQQRWQEEMLRREAEQLQKKLQQLAASNAQGQQSGTQAGNSSAGEANAQPGGGASQDAQSGRLQRAIDRLRQANAALRRATGSGSSAADARRAADDLAEAAKLMSGLGRQQASGQLDSLARESSRLSGEEHDQAARLRQIFGGPQHDRPGWPRFDGGSQQQAKLADNRQLLATDLARLKRQMQDSAERLQSTEPGAASKLQQALGEMERADLENRLNRSAELIRLGIDPNSRVLEPAITAGIDRMNRDVQEAQQGLKPQAPNPAEQELARVERLRSAIEALSRGPGDAGTRNGRPRGQSSSAQPNLEAQNGQASQGGNENSGFQSGGPGGPRVWRGGRGPGLGTFIERQGGENEKSSGGPAFNALALREAMRQLDGLRRELRSDPQSSAEVQQLARELQRLGAGTYGTEPAVLQQLSAQALASTDRVELLLRRRLEEQQSGQVRNGGFLQIPPDYQESVAEYFRRLSKSH